MRRFLIVAGSILLMFTATVLHAADKRSPRLVKLSDSVEGGEIRPWVPMTTADTCIVRHDQGIYYKIDGWVTGNELYKSYLDPAAGCAEAYPFTITEINMPMYFVGTPTFNVSVDVELVDNSVPNCPLPGELLTISSEYILSIPEAGLWNLWIPLDTPVVVNGPFFAGFFISTSIAQSDSAAVLVDTIPTPCVSFNIWDTTVGFVDLTNNEHFDFPGRLVLYAAGIPSGVSGPPAVDLVYPTPSDSILGSAEIWLRDRSGSTVLDFAEFEYRLQDDTIYTSIGQDFDGTRSFRNGLDPSGGGDGFSYRFDASALTEGHYYLRATLYDTLGRADADSVQVFVEPTPPLPTPVSHADGETFCETIELDFVSPDENLDFVQTSRKVSEAAFSLGIAAAGARGRGPAWCAPYSFAMALDLWYERGYTKPMSEFNAKLPIDTMAARLADRFNTTDNFGTYDVDLLFGLMEYLKFKLSDIEVFYQRQPDYYDLRNRAENYEYTALIGLGGSRGLWVTVDGFDGWRRADSSFRVRVAHPTGGVIEAMPVRNTQDGAEGYLDGIWRPIDIMIWLGPPDWTVNRQAIGADLNGLDGWSVNWTAAGAVEGDHYYFHTFGRDEDGIREYSTLLIGHSCADSYIKGDYNDDGFADIADADYLLEHLALGGPAPVGGTLRADANCDGYPNIADVVYFLRYVFSGGTEPCY